MYPPEFEYLQPATVEAAVEALAANPGAQILAGGHSLLPMMKTGMAYPDTLVDISQIDDLQGIEADEEEARIGALTTYATISESPVIRSGQPALAETVHAIGDIQVRNRGTIGGNLAHADPASDLPAAALVADATLELTGPDGTRRVPAESFFFGMFATDVGEAELVTRVDVPLNDRWQGGYAKRASPSSGYAIVGVTAALHVENDEIAAVRLAANGVEQTATRLRTVEDHLLGESPSEASVAAAAAVAEEDIEEAMLMDDRQASGEFRVHLLETYIKRAIEAALEPEATAR